MISGFQEKLKLKRYLYCRPGNRPQKELHDAARRDRVPSKADFVAIYDPNAAGDRGPPALLELRNRGAAFERKAAAI